MRALPKYLLNTDRYGASTTALGRLFFIVKWCFISSFVQFSFPIISYRGEETGTTLYPAGWAAQSNELTSQPSFLLTQEMKCPQPLFTGHAFQPCYLLSCLPPDNFKDLNIFVTLWRPELRTVLEVRPHHTNSKYSKKNNLQICTLQVQ